MQVRELVTRLGFDADTVAAQKYGKAVDDVRRVAQRAAIAMAGISTAATGLVWHFTNASSETLAWSNRLGIATDELQRLQFAADKYQISNKALIDGLKELSLRTDEFAKEGAGEAVEAFERLDLSARDLNSVSGDTAELFRLVQSRVANIQNVSERQRIADELFGGEAGEQFTEFLGASGDEIERLGRLAEQTGSVVPRDVLERAREFSRETGTLQATVGGFGKVLAAELLPFYRELVDLTQSWLQGNTMLIRQNIRLWVERLAFGVRTIASVVVDFIGWVDELVESVGGWDRVMRLVAVSIGWVVGMRLASWLRGVAGGMASAAGATRLFAGALRLVKRLAFITLLEDIVVWINGGDSALGKWIGSWEDFKAKAQDVLSDVKERIADIKRELVAASKVAIGIATADINQIRSGIDDLRKARAETTEDAETAAEQRRREYREKTGRKLLVDKPEQDQQGSSMFDDIINQASALSPANAAASLVDSDFGRGLRSLFTGGAAAGGFTVPTRESGQGATQEAQSNNAIRRMVDGMRGLQGQIGYGMGRLTGGLEPLFAGQPAMSGLQSSTSSRGSVQVNAKTEATLQVPQGTSEDQRRWLEQQAETIFGEHWDRQINKALWDFQPVEG